jgi:hypothetical protein
MTGQQAQQFASGVAAGTSDCNPRTHLSLPAFFALGSSLEFTSSCKSMHHVALICNRRSP